MITDVFERSQELATEPSDAPAVPVSLTSQTPNVEQSELRALIAERAYFIAERRGFDAGHDVEDWLQAEAEVLDSFAAPVR
jgi:hypothetical protein